MTPDDAPGMFFQDRYLHPVRPDFRRFAENSGLAAMAATAANSKNIRLYYDHVFVKDPGTQEQFVWHQDRPYWAVDGTQICSTWLALTDANSQSSAREFVRGSHLWGRTFRPEYPALDGLPQERSNEPSGGASPNTLNRSKMCVPPSRNIQIPMMWFPSMFFPAMSCCSIFALFIEAAQMTGSIGALPFRGVGLGTMPSGLQKPERIRSSEMRTRF